MINIKPRWFSNAKLVTVFNGDEAEFYGIGHNTRARMIAVYYKSIDNPVHSIYYKPEDEECYFKDMSDIQLYCINNPNKIKSMLKGLAAIDNEEDAKFYANSMLKNIHDAEEMRKLAINMQYGEQLSSREKYRYVNPNDVAKTYNVVR
jgi:hypothetical protein